ncbi:CYTH-like domain-containing protein [Strongyloides ratti]|uniref:CYTH-like domain-containing protein n=1 Tax=Strongyloides ratti TaxID=34506 RepID=A0A090MMX5_STRRB|nr:CYTH-like domain-containing protein [Strongyloides ratti]CEF59386.1 CYTH-like domain-containing protein [Strongyloides ratti]
MDNLLFDNTIRFVKVRAPVDNVETMESMIFKFTESLGRRSQIETIYFNTFNGVLKIRQYRNADNYGELISYTKAPSKSRKCVGEMKYATLENCIETTSVLSYALGEKTGINILRRQFEKDCIIINLDFVEGLGHFMSLKYILDKDKNISDEEAFKIITDIMKKHFNYVKKDFLPVSTYVDLLKCNGLPDSDYDEDHTSDSS